MTETACAPRDINSLVGDPFPPVAGQLVPVAIPLIAVFSLPDLADAQQWNFQKPHDSDRIEMRSIVESVPQPDKKYDSENQV